MPTMMKIMILIVILACIGPFFIKGPDGEPLMSLDDWLPETASVPEAPVKTTVYKYKDENGNWVFTNDPIENEQAETMEIDAADINTMDEFKAPPTTSSAALSGNASGMQIPAGVTSVAPEKVAEMMETVTNLQETVDQRKADMDKATGQ